MGGGGTGFGGDLLRDAAIHSRSLSSPVYPLDSAIRSCARDRCLTEEGRQRETLRASLVQVCAVLFPVGFGNGFEILVVLHFGARANEVDNSIRAHSDAEASAVACGFGDLHVEVLSDVGVFDKDDVLRVGLFADAPEAASSVADEEF